jgi:hypothetical protein
MVLKMLDELWERRHRESFGFKDHRHSVVTVPIQKVMGHRAG